MSPNADGFLVKDPLKELDTQGSLKLATLGGWVEGEGEGGGRARSWRPLGLHLGEGRVSGRGGTAEAMWECHDCSWGWGLQSGALGR